MIIANNGIIVQSSIATITNTNILPEDNFNHFFHEVGQYHERYGALGKVILKDNVAFVASYWGGVLIFNLSEPNQPELISTFIDDCVITGPDACTEEMAHIALEDDLLLYAHGREGLLLINVSNPTKPFLLGRYERYLYGVEVQGELAYLLCPGIRQINYGGVIQIVNISNPIKPEFLGEVDYSLTGGNFFGLEVKGNYIYSMIAGDLLIINCSDPTTPTLLSTFTMGEPFFMTNLFIKGDIAYLASSGTDGSIATVDISNPAEPKEIAAIRDHYISACYDVVVQGDYIFIADGAMNWKSIN
ncbi:MAG: hypothetical protein JXA54_07665 [Candidatus Heimdallarchaeota archaeon]|nr:hypothetical protein [Candidatus Heimdallarchaeota archaeon]